MEKEIEIRNVDYTDAKFQNVNSLASSQSGRFILKLAKSNSIIIKSSAGDDKITEITILAKGSMHEINSKFRDYSNHNYLEMSKPDKLRKHKESSKKHKHSSHVRPTSNKNYKVNVGSSIKDMEDKILRLSKSYNRMKNNKEAFVEEQAARDKRQGDFTVYETMVPCNVSKNLQNQQIYATPRTMSRLKISLACQSGEHNHGKHCICQRCNMMGIVMESQKRIMEDHGPPPERMMKGHEKSAAFKMNECTFNDRKFERESKEEKLKRRHRTSLFLNDLAARVKKLEDKNAEIAEKFLEKEQFKIVMSHLIFQSKKSKKSQLSCLNENFLQHRHQEQLKNPTHRSPKVLSRKTSICRTRPQNNGFTCLGQSNYCINNASVNHMSMDGKISDSSGLTFNSNCFHLIEEACSQQPVLQLLKINENFKNSSYVNDVAIGTSFLEDIKRNVEAAVPDLCFHNSTSYLETVSVSLQTSRRPSTIIVEIEKDVTTIDCKTQTQVSNYSVFQQTEEICNLVDKSINVKEHARVFVEEPKMNKIADEMKNADEHVMEIRSRSSGRKSAMSYSKRVHDHAPQFEEDVGTQASPKAASIHPVKVTSLPNNDKKNDCGEKRLKKSQIPTFRTAKPLEKVAAKVEEKCIKARDIQFSSRASQRKHMESHEKIEARAENLKACKRKKSMIYTGSSRKSDLTRKWVKQSSDYVNKRLNKELENEEDTGNQDKQELVKKECNKSDSQKEKMWKYICKKIEKVDNVQQSSFNVILELATNDGSEMQRTHRVSHDPELELSLDELQIILKDPKSAFDEASQCSNSSSTRRDAQFQKVELNEAAKLRKSLIMKLAKFNLGPQKKF